MWSFRAVIRPIFLATGLLAGAISVSGCSFSPLYGETTTGQLQQAFSYAQPTSRIEQVIYQEFAKNFGTANDADAPIVSMTTSTSTRRVGRTSNASPAITYEVRVTARVVLAKKNTDGSDQEVYAVQRDASASYSVNDQRLTDQFAEQEAKERAAKSVAQSLRLILAAKLPSVL